ncbi:MAG: flagellar basal-body MS-ring/collar protein FliF [Bacillota bacterium]|nr:flagellar basal-body MS-ring/collar protein FliF [Bacillota bacterium]
MAESNKSENRVAKVWKGIERGRRIGIIAFLLTIVLAFSIYYIFVGRTTYTQLFSGLGMKESANIVSKLDDMKITNYKIENEGSTILVSQKDADKIRLELAMSDLLPEIGVGYEIFDNASFAITDEDRKIMYQRALEGELARSIMSLDEVKYARVHLALTEETLFSREETSGSATVIIEINPIMQFSSNRVKGIVALISSAVKNIPPENISVVDTKANLLSENLYSDPDSMTIGQSAIDSISIKQQFESKLEDELQRMLELTFGKGKILVNVNAKLDLNSEELTIIEYDEDGILRSQQDSVVKTAFNGDVVGGSSPVDNNIEYYISNTQEAMNNSSVSNFETVRNYEIGETKTYRIKAPGEVVSLSTSVIYDGELSEANKISIRNIVAAAVGIDETRGDIVSVEGIMFDKTYEQNAINEFNIAQEEYLKEQETKKKFMFYGSVAGGSVLLILIIIIIIKAISGSKKNKQNFYDAMQPIPISELEQQSSETARIKPFKEKDIERGVKDYADENPEKLADLVKTWMLKDEG